MLPAIPWYYKVLAVAALLLGAYIFGRHDGGVQADLAIAKYEKLEIESAAKIKEAASHVEVKVVTEYVDKIKEVVRIKTVYKERAVNNVPDKVELSNGWVDTHNGAALGLDPDTVNSKDDTSSGVPANVALGTVVDNYGVCRENQQKLDSLQKYLVEVKAAVEKYNKSLENRK